LLIITRKTRNVFDDRKQNAYDKDIFSVNEGVSMQQEERLAAVLRHLQQHHRITVEQMCDRFGISRDSARRDLVKLEERGEIIRVRGGAVLPTLTKHVQSYEERLNNPAGKREIGRVAASLIHSGDYVLLDTATTVQFAAEWMSAEPHVVVTNSIDVADIFSRKRSAEIHLLGGQLNVWHRGLFGPKTIAALHDMRVDKLLLGACGITPEGLTAHTVDEAYVKMAMLECADQVIVLADSSKFGKRLFHKVCGLDKIDIVVTDAEPTEEVRAALEQAGVELLVASRSTEQGRGES
jgi:DeoR family transcriptional regulator, carbon catabolite repression regulator